MRRFIVSFLALGFLGGCVSSTDLSNSSTGDGDASGNGIYYQSCVLIIQRFQQCSSPISCTFTTDAISDCEDALAKEPNTNVTSIVQSSCDIIVSAICTDATYSQYCTCT